MTAGGTDRFPAVNRKALEPLPKIANREEVRHQLRPLSFHVSGTETVEFGRAQVEKGTITVAPRPLRLFVADLVHALRLRHVPGVLTGGRRRP